MVQTSIRSQIKKHSRILMLRVQTSKQMCTLDYAKQVNNSHNQANASSVQKVTHWCRCLSQDNAKSVRQPSPYVQVEPLLVQDLDIGGRTIKLVTLLVACIQRHAQVCFHLKIILKENVHMVTRVSFVLTVSLDFQEIMSSNVENVQLKS